MLECGVQVENAVMLPNYMKNDDEKAKFQGAKVNDVIVFNPANAYNNSEVELASLLKLDKSVAAEKKGDFSFQVEEITRYEPAPVNQELFDRMLGEGVVKSEEEFREYIKKNMETQFVADSEYKFMLDLRAYLTDRIGEVEFPEAILKRIMKLNKPDDEEYVEKNFEGSLKELLWHLIKEQLSDQLQIKVEQADVMEAAKEATRMQFAQYGMMNIPDESLEQYATEMLKNKEQAEGLVSRTVENKIAKAAQDVLTLKKKEVSLEEFNNLFQSEKTA